MVKAIKKAIAMVFSVMVLVAVFGLLANPTKDAYAAENGVGDFDKVVQDSVAAGIKTGTKLIQSKSTRTLEDGQFYFNSDSKSNPIAKDVLILLDEAGNINSQEDLESYLNGERDLEKPLMMYTEPVDGVTTVLAVWSLSNEEFNVHTSGGADIFPGAPQFFKDILAKNGYRLHNVTPRDPDGNCNGSVLGCFRHNDGGYTGFHLYACYTGRWDHVNEMENKSSYKMSAYELNGHPYEVQRRGGVIFGASNAKSFDTVLFS